METYSNPVLNGRTQTAFPLKKRNTSTLTIPFINVVLEDLARVSVLEKAVKAIKMEKEHVLLPALLCIHRGDNSGFENI